MTRDRPLQTLFSVVITLYLSWLCWVFIAACGLSLSVVNMRYSLFAVHRLVIVVASLGAEQGPWVHGLSSCGVQV